MSEGRVREFFGKLPQGIDMIANVNAAHIFVFDQVSQVSPRIHSC